LSFTDANCVAANNGDSYPTFSTSGVYVEGIQYALNTFHPLTNVYQYLDIGQSAWLGWTSNMTPAIADYKTLVTGTTAGYSSIDGFISDTANYVPTKEPFMTGTEEIGGNEVGTATFYQFNYEIDEEDYDATLYSNLVSAGFPSTLGFLIDTSRNGWGGSLRPTAASTSTVLNTFVDASKIDERGVRGVWCNIENSGLGVPPTANPGGFSQLEAYVWIKPPGESDGTYPGSVYNGTTETGGDPNCNPNNTNSAAGGPTDSLPNSPPAGTFWITEFTMLVQNSYPVVPSSTAPGFSISASGVSVEQGTAAATSVAVTPFNGFSGTVALSVSGLPAGVTAAFNPTSVTGSAGSTLTFTASATATVGAATVTVTGTSGSTTETTTLSLTVIAEPNFTISVSPAAISLPSGSNPTSTITVTFVGGLTGSVSLSAGNLPSGVSANFAPSSLNASGTSVVNFTSQPSTPSGTTNISITGTDGSITNSATIALTVPGSGSCTTVPSAPTGLTATAASSSGINLSWTAVTPPTNCTITSYTVYRSTTSGFTPSSSNQVGSVTSGTSFSDTGLTASTTYYYKIEAVDADGSSAASAQASATTSAASSCTTVPTAPTGLTATAASSSGINLSWTAVTPPANCTITSYPVYRSTTSGFTPSSSNQVGTVTSGTTFSDTGLTASTTYYYKVEAVDAEGSSAASSQASATTSAASGGFACHIGYTISSQWPGGFGAAITINNTGTTAISNWTLTWTFANGQTITQIWNGTETQSGANVTVNNLSYNGTIAAGGNYSGMGFNGSWNNTTNAVPTSFAVNGTTCN
jgi:cellulose 1,4-beta-cellobiosidase